MRIKHMLLTATATVVMAGAAATSASAVSLTPNPFEFDDTAATMGGFSIGPTASSIDCGQGVTGNTANSTSGGFVFRPHFEDCVLQYGMTQFAVEVTAHADWRVAYTGGDVMTGVTGQLDLDAPSGSGPALELVVIGNLCTIEVDAQENAGSVSLHNTNDNGASLQLDLDGFDAEIASQQGFCPGLYRAPTYGLTGYGAFAFPGVAMS
jgi:hypothetical protein